MSFFKTVLVTSSMLVLSTSLALAQKDTKKEPAPEANQSAEPSYFQKFRDWSIECANVSGKEECQIYHVGMAEDPSDKTKKIPVMRISVALLEQKQPVMIFSAPLGVYLMSGIQPKLDGKTIMVTVEQEEGKNKKLIETDIKQLNFERCVMNGCMAALPLDIDKKNALLGKLKSANAMDIWFTFDPNAKPKQDINLKASLGGFTDAYNELIKRNK